MQKIVAAGGAIETVTPLSVVTWTAEPVRSTGADASDRVVALYGEAAGGQPGFPYVFTDPGQAAKVLLSGTLLQGVQYAFANGAPDGKRPRAVVAANTRGGTTASYAVKDTASKTVFTLKTRTFREAANQTTLSLSGSRATGFNLQIKDALAGIGAGYTKLGLGLYIQYVGSGSAATAEVLDIAGAKHLKTTVTGGAAGESLLLPLGDITVRDLAQQIVAAGPYNVLTAREAALGADGLDIQSATTIHAFALIGTTTTKVAAGATSVTLGAASTRALVAGETLQFRAGGVRQFVTVAADAAAGTTFTINPLSIDIPASAVLLGTTAAAPVALSAVRADFADFLSNKAQGVVEYVDGVDDAGDPVAQGGNFTGGGSTGATIADWADAVEASLDEDFGAAVALTDDQGLVFGVRARLQAARNPAEGKFIQLFSGIDSALLPADESDASLSAYLQNVTAHVAGVNDRDSVVVAQQGEATDQRTGRTARVAPYFVAAILAGYAASLGRSESLTYKSLALANPYPNLRTRKDAFTLAGVTVLVPPKKSLSARVELGRTAYVGEDNTIYEAEKSVRLMNGIARDIKTIQSQMIPGEASPAALGRYKKQLTDYFNGLVAQGLLVAGIDQDGNAVAPYDFKVGRTQYQGRLVTTTALVNPTGEFVVADFNLRARPVEIEV